MNAEEFKLKFGREPIQDDLHRVNCDKVGDIGHQMCGICFCGKLRFECGGLLGHAASVEPPKTIYGGGEIPIEATEALQYFQKLILAVQNGQLEDINSFSWRKGQPAVAEIKLKHPPNRISFEISLEE